MILIKNRGFKKTYAYGGSGIFDTLAKFLSRLLASEGAKKIATTALDVGKSAAADAGKKAVSNIGKKIMKKWNKPVDVSEKANSILNKYLDQPNINSIIDGSGGAIRIQELVRKLNGAGLKKI